MFLDKARGALPMKEDKAVLADSAKNICAKEGSTYVVVEDNEPRDLDAHHEVEGAEGMDIGTNTQVALEAMDIMRHGAPSNSLGDEEGNFTASGVGNDTQTALDAMDILRHGIDISLGPLKGERKEANEDVQCLLPQDFSHIEKVVQAKALSAGVCSDKKRGLPSRSPTGSKASHKKGFSRGAFKPSKMVEKLVSLKMPCPVSNNKRFYLDFSSAMVPRRKRSRQCSPRISFNENMEAFGWQKSAPPVSKSLQECDKQDKSEERKNLLWPGDSTELPVLTESTNGRRTKRGLLTRSECHIFLEQNRKRRKCDSKSIFVLFSHSLSESIIKQQKKVLKKLGGHVATLAVKATHFVADSFVRSKNMLEIMAAGKAVVTTNWLEGCSQAQYFVVEESYILQDTQKEKEWGFCMHSSLASSKRRPLLKGLNVLVSPNTVPDFASMKAIIESAGGQVLPKLSISHHLNPDDIASISFVLANEDDSDFCAEYIKDGCRVYSTELILHGVIVQSLDLSKNRLFVD
ncbi:hypothetical protein L7F22_006261 [Adiantum nelumboides]|nr:hypothetical protein [Adiantum nelumboides]